MSTIDTSTWNPDADLNTEIEGIPLNADAGIAQTWQVIRILMAAFKGDTSAIEAMMVPFSGATATADGASGLVPKPEAGDQDKVLKGDGSWGTVPPPSVAWSDVTGKPSSFTPSSHTHGNLTNDGKLSTASRAVVTDGDKAIGVSSVTATELGRLSGVTSAVQTQLDGKIAKAGDTMTGTLTVSMPSPGVCIQDSDVAKGTNPTSTRYLCIPFFDKNGTANVNRVGVVEALVSSTGTTTMQIGAYKYVSGSTDMGNMGIRYDANGSNAYTFAPTPDASDNSTKIATTAFVKAQGYVANSGEQTINSLVVSPSGNLHKDVNSGMLYMCGGTASTGAEGAYMILVGSTNSQGSPGCFFLRAATSTSNVRTFKGAPDGTLTWNGQAIQTSSDERLKTPVTDVPDAVLDAWEDVRWGQFRYLDAVERKGNSARLHLGMIAQRVKAAFEARGLDACAYGILCYEEEDDLWMVRYTEALAMEAAWQRRRADRLETRIAALEEALHA